MSVNDQRVTSCEQLPEGWRAAPLKALFRVVGGSTPKSDREEFWDGDVIWVTPSDLQDGAVARLQGSQRTITELGLKSCGTTLVPPNTIVVSTRAPIGSLGIAEVPLCTNQGCKALVPSSVANPTFYAYFLSINTTELRIRGKGTTFLELSSYELGAFQVPVPPLSEQTAIAAFLDRETGKIDTLVEEQKRLIELLKEKRQAVISHAVTKGIDPNVRMKPSGVEWLGDVPEHWEVKRLGQIALSLQTGPFGSQLHAVDYVEGGTPVINPSNLISGEIVPEWSNTVDDALASALARHRLDVGDIVFGRRGEMGRCALVTEKDAGCLCGTGCLRARLVDIRFSEFASTFFQTTAVASYLRLVSVGSTMDNLNTTILARTPIPCPPVDEALQIIETLHGAIARIDALTEKAVHGITLLGERRSALISAAVTGKIDVRNFAAQEEAA